ncbi:DUF6151 family protein [Acaryochloris marina]|uniref:CENP-V/GFA domain-containing protein n=1 Tax=Acaryochloris marina (strain MBIC 11017) TaxID=329726 RepID=B0BYY1_ACAM1|nr:DUF6151 family protein [Acaryochloris marina]ABW28281.1 hypothetical protein AM1_3287 [Acaryochloris marina MBIC11017]BDM77310.1 hypothetical protein AM10699_01840 [Acaryochloris marina MBIC10699]
MAYSIQCQCGRVQGRVNHPKNINRVTCYCRDCQAFANFLGRSAEILDPQGGTEIVQMLPKHISFDQGAEYLACMRLTESGLLRWYTTCCNTPIGNTLPSHKMSFVGVVHNCLESSDITLDELCTSESAHVNTAGAKGDPKPKPAGQVKAIIRNLLMILKARIDGSYQQTPFFEVGSGLPITTPKILSSQEYEELMNTV